MFRILINALIIALLCSGTAFAKRYSGSAWADDDCKYYNGSAWVDCTKNRYSGSAWVEIEAAASGGAGTVSYSSAGTVAHVEANTTLTLTAPSNSSGDLLIAVISDDADQALTDLDGFTLITSQSESSHRLSVARLTATGATSYDFVSGSSEKTGFIVRLTKDDGTWNIADYDSDGTTQAEGGTVTCPDMTVSQDDSMVLVFYGNDDDKDINTEPTGMTAMTTEYTTNDPRVQGWYQAYDTGTVTGKSASPLSGSDYTLIGIVVEAEE